MPIAVMGVTDPDGDAVTITVTGVTHDEPVNAQGDGNTSPDAVIEVGRLHCELNVQVRAMAVSIRCPSRERTAKEVPVPAL